MCSFGSCQTHFEFLSQFRKVRNAFECFVTQVQTHLPKTKLVWPMKINVICTVYTPKVLLPPFIHYHHDPILFSLCFMTNTLTSDSDTTFVVIYGFLHLMSPRTMR